MCASRRLLPRLRESKFRGYEIPKTSPASISHEATFGIIAKGPSFKPDMLIKSLRDLSSVCSPSLAALSVLANRSAVSSTQFFPPQILETLDLFAKSGYSADAMALFAFLTARKDDLLNEASPKRIVVLMEAIAEIQLPMFHLSLWPDLREALVRVLPQLKRGTPTVLQALSKAGCTDSELVEALLVQAECCWLQGEIETKIFAHAIEAASRMSFASDPVRASLTVALSKRPIEKLSQLQSVALLVAALRAGADETTIAGLRARIKSFLARPDTPFDVARCLAGVCRHGVSLSPAEESLVNDFVESKLSDVNFAKFMPYTLRDLSLCSSGIEFTRVALENVVSQKSAIDRFSAEKLLALLRAAVLSGCGMEVVSRLVDPMTRSARQLSIRQARQLWEIVPGLVPVSPLPPLLPRGLESAPLSLETVGPYSLHRSDKGLQLLLPQYQVTRPGDTSSMRRDIELRLAAIHRDLQSRDDKSAASIVTSFS